ncbi:MAG: hypothetical protein ACRDGU_02210 [Actinomycetota bacterium]
METSNFPSEHHVIHCLVTYTDWWQTDTSSVLQVAGARRGNALSDGFREGLLGTLDARTELCRRVWQLDPKDRHLLFLWYVKQLPVDEISTEIRLSRRQCFRRRARAINSLVDRPDQAA